jgi:hypothetical protein
MERLQSLSLAIYDASRTRDDDRLLKLFREYESLDLSADMIEPAMRDYQDVLADLNRYRETALARCSSRS